MPSRGHMVPSSVKHAHLSETCFLDAIHCPILGSYWLMHVITLTWKCTLWIWVNLESAWNIWNWKSRFAALVVDQCCYIATYQLLLCSIHQNWLTKKKHSIVKEQTFERSLVGKDRFHLWNLLLSCCPHDHRRRNTFFSGGGHTTQVRGQWVRG